MPKIYNPEDVKFVWDLIQNNGMKRAAVAELMHSRQGKSQGNRIIPKNSRISGNSIPSYPSFYV